MKTIIDWYPAIVAPQANKPILVYTENGKLMTLKSVKNKDTWKWYTDKYAITLWVYQDLIRIVNK